MRLLPTPRAHATIEQRQSVFEHHVGTEAIGAEHALPDWCAGGGKQGQPHQRDDQQPWIQIRIQPSIRLRQAEALRQQLRQVRDGLIEQHFAQRAAFAQHLAHPQRGQPRLIRHYRGDPAHEIFDQ